MRKISFIFALLILVWLPRDAQAAGKRFLDIQEVKSSSGVTAWLVEAHDQHLIALDIAFLGAGASLDPADKQGLVHMTGVDLSYAILIDCDLRRADLTGALLYNADLSGCLLADTLIDERYRDMALAAQKERQ